MPQLTDSRAARLKLPESGQKYEWDSKLSGFGVRLTPGARSWFVQGRYEGGSLD